MALDVRIISGGSTYYLVNSSGSPTAGGAATAAATTPYSVAASEWTQSATKRLVTYSGGPPFGIGSKPIYVGFDNVQETIQIGISGSSSDNAISLIRSLRQILNTALYSTPAILYWLPNGATNPAYFEIYSADVQEVGDWQNPAAGFTQVLCQVTWTRSAFGGRLSTGETLVNAVSLQSRFTGSPACYTAFSAGSGELIYDGQPLNVATTVSASTGGLYIGVVDSVISQASTQSVTGTTSTTGTYSAASDTVTLGSTLQSKQGLKMRLFVQINGSPAAGNPEFQAVVSYSSSYSAGLGIVYQSPWVGRPAYNDCTYDMGSVPTAWLLDTNATVMAPWLRVRSTTGGSTTMAINAWYVVLYYTMCRVDPQANLVLRTFVETSNRPCLPMRRPAAFAPSSGTPAYTVPVIGTPPRYYSGASLMVHPRISYGFTSANNTTPAAYTATATHAPLYHTLRGNG